LVERDGFEPAVPLIQHAICANPQARLRNRWLCRIAPAPVTSGSPPTAQSVTTGATNRVHLGITPVGLNPPVR
jgi:hypothetical protein